MGKGGHAEFIKPQSCKLHYGSLVLDNGLQAVVISDEKADKSSAALDVHVGSMSDPVELPGLAHFLEHMLFYANSKYPEEDAYSKFISEHGGHTNAFTAAEDTNYYFEVNHDHLEPALDRFAQFFICPLISEDGVGREVQAVDSEHGKNVNTDAWRLNQLWRSTADKSHPYSRFHTGNLDTLITRPKAKGISPHHAVRQFAEDMYSANLMRLVVYGRESVAELKDLVTAKFSTVVDKGLAPPRFSGDVMLAKQKPRLLKVVPQKQTDSLVLQWPIEPQCGLYESLPTAYVSHLLGHEGVGSIYAVLKARGWATQLSAGESGDSFSGRSFFMVSVILTKEGNMHASEVAGLICACINILKQPGGVTQERFDEMQALSRMRFNFSDKLNPGRLTSALSQTLQHVPAHHSLLALHNVPLQYDPEGIGRVLAGLTPNNLRIMWSSQDFKGHTDSTEVWYGTEYSTLEVPQEWRDRLTQPGEDSELHLPKENPFIPTDFTMLQAGEEEGKDGKTVAPRVVHSSDLLQLYHKVETSFGTPKAMVYLAFHCPEAYATPEAAVLTRLFVKLLDDRLSELSYEAELAGLGYSALNTTYGFMITFGGYNHKMMALVRHVLSAVVSLQVDQERFQVQKEAVTREYANKKFEQPYQSAMYTARMAHEFKRWHTSEYQAVIGDLTAADLQVMARRLLRRVWVQGYASGNFSDTDALGLAELVESLLKDEAKAQPIFDSQRDDPRVVKLQPGKPALIQMPTPNPDNDNSAIILSYQVGPDEPMRNMLGELWVRCTKQEAFHRLRSQQQLGYIVFLTTWSSITIRSLAFILQSTAYPAATLEERCEAFLEDAWGLLEGMTDQEFSQHVEELSKAKLEAPKRLRDQAAREWREIDDAALMFDRPQQEVAALRRLAKEDLVTFFREHVYDFQTRRKLAVQVQGASKSAAGANGNAAENGTAEQTESSSTSANDNSTNGMAANGVASTSTSGNGEGPIESPKLSDGNMQGTSTLKARGLSPKPDVVSDVWAFKRSQVLYPSGK